MYLPNKAMHIAMPEVSRKNHLLKDLRLSNNEFKTFGQPVNDMSIFWNLSYERWYCQKVVGFMNEVGDSELGLVGVYKDILKRHYFILKFKIIDDFRISSY